MFRNSIKASMASFEVLTMPTDGVLDICSWVHWFANGGRILEVNIMKAKILPNEMPRHTTHATKRLGILLATLSNIQTNISAVADIIIAPHGAHLTNAVLMRHHAVLVEIMPWTSKLTPTQEYKKLVQFENSTTHYVKLCGRRQSKAKRNDVNKCGEIEVASPEKCEGCECESTVLQEAVNTAITIEREHTHVHNPHTRA